MIAVVDYGMGNLASVQKAFAFLGAKGIRVTADPKEVARSKAVVFPGVGAFGEAMAELKSRRLIDPIRESIREGKPFLGLCLGLQLLFSDSDEAPGVRGLGVLPGRVRKFPAKKGLKVPHMGWNQIEKSGSRKGEGPLQGIPDGAFMYFVHSFYAEPEEAGLIAATTEYGRQFPCVISDGQRLWATQFHPEKSQKWGLRILKNFMVMVNKC